MSLFTICVCYKAYLLSSGHERQRVCVRSFRVCTGVCTGVCTSVCVCVCLNVNWGTQLCTGMHGCAQVWAGVHGCVRVCAGMHRCLQECGGLVCTGVCMCAGPWVRGHLDYFFIALSLFVYAYQTYRTSNWTLLRWDINFKNLGIDTRFLQSYHWLANLKYRCLKNLFYAIHALNCNMLCFVTDKCC